MRFLVQRWMRGWTKAAQFLVVCDALVLMVGMRRCSRCLMTSTVFDPVIPHACLVRRLPQLFGKLSE